MPAIETPHHKPHAARAGVASSAGRVAISSAAAFLVSEMQIEFGRGLVDYGVVLGRRWAA